MKPIFLLFAFLFTCISINAQTDYPELKKIRENYTNGRQQGNAELVQSAIQDCQHLIVQYQKENNQKGLAKVYTLYGQILVENGKFPESKEPLTKALDLSTKEFGADADETIEAKKFLSWSYGYLGDADTELKYSLEILDAYKKNETKYTLEIADLYNTIGMNYGARNNRTEERKYLNDAQQILENYKAKSDEEKVQVQALLSNVFNSMSQSYIGSIDYANALLYAKMSLQISEKIAPNNPERSATMIVVGRCIYTLEKKCDSAVYFIDNALKLLEANQLMASPMWLSYRSYKVNILARCGNGDEAKAVARGTIKTLLDKGISPEEALTQLLILSQNINAELTTMENQYREKESVARQKQFKERLMFGGSSLILLLGSVTTFIFFRRRRKNELKTQREAIMNRISKDLHDEIGSGLTKISMMCRQGEADLKKQKPIESSFLDKVTFESRNLSQNLGELVWATNPEKANLESLTAEIRKYTNEFFENSNIEHDLKITDGIESYSTHPEANRNIYLILKEGLNNIVKHSSATHATVAFEVATDKKFKLTITDNGKGFDTTATTERTGKKSMEQRATSISNGKFELKSEAGKGTSITVTGNLT